MRLLRTAALGVLLSGCKDRNATAVVVAISSEPKIPTEISRMEIVVTRGGVEKFRQGYDLKAGQRLPGTLTLQKDEDADASEPIVIRVSASKGAGKPARVVREARLSFVEEKSKLLRMPLRYSCVGGSSVCKEGETCIGGVCRPASVDVVALADYIGPQKEIVQVPAEALKQPGQALAESSGCFPQESCFEGGVDVPISGEGCSFKAPGPEGTFNVGMRWQQTPGRVAVLEQDPFEGYELKDGRVVLSPGLCDALKDHRARSVVVSEDCSTKAYEDPICDVEGVQVDESCEPTFEVCNGLDDDCDGIVDNDLGDEGVYCSAAGKGRCGSGIALCGEDGKITCEPLQPEEEECNGLDDDCDGDIDETCTCEPGTESACYTGPDGTADVGSCRSGVQLCNGSGTFDDCQGAIEPTTELCNGLDDNCDGFVDEGCTCQPGATQACYTGPYETSGVGECREGVQSCVDGFLGPCEGEVLPLDEVCNKLDDNCDGTVDEGCGCEPGAAQSCYEGPDGTQNVGECRAGVQSCIDGFLGACEGAIVPVGEECNGLDDDCDGVVDNGCEPSGTGGGGGAGGESGAGGEGGDSGTGGDSGAAGSGGGEVCPEGTADCDLNPETFCETDTLFSGEHCGVCDNACAPGQSCQQGVCCEDGLQVCGGLCVDVQTDQDHCGMCNNPCGALMCTNGMCL